MSASNGWAKAAPLGELLIKNDRTTAIEVDETYREVTIKLWGKGVVERRTTTGSEIAAARRSVVKAGDFILSRIDARNGAMGIIPPELDGAVVSNDFPSFATVGDRLLPEYLGWLSKTQSFVDACRRASEGTTNRVRLKEEKFLNQTIPLPPLSEQRRMVAKIERLARKTAEVRCLAESAAEARHRLAIAMALRGDLSDGAKHSAGWQKLPLGEVMQLALSPVSVDPTEQYANIGILSYGKGVFLKPPILGSSTSASKLYKVKSGQFIYSRLFAFEGAYATVPEEADGTFVSNEFPTFDLNLRLALPALLSAYFSSPSTWSALISSSKGMGSRRQRIHPDSILDHEVWIPPMSWQEKIAFVSDRNRTAKSAESRLTGYSEALLPSILDRAFSGEYSTDHPAATTGRSTADNQLAKRSMFYVAILLRHWSMPVARNVLDACLALMLSDQARKKILSNGSFQASSADRSNPQLRSLDSLLGQMRARKVVKITTRNERQFLELGEQAPPTDSVTAADKERLEEAIAAFEIVGEDRAADLLAGMIDTTYELTAT